MNFSISQFLNKLQNLPDTQKKIILWTIVVIIALPMLFFWINGALNTFSKIGEAQFIPDLSVDDQSQIPQEFNWVGTYKNEEVSSFGDESRFYNLEIYNDPNTSSLKANLEAYGIQYYFSANAYILEADNKINVFFDSYKSQNGQSAKHNNGDLLFSLDKSYNITWEKLAPLNLQASDKFIKK
ncbi:MAG: DUF5991 domain-containing protein [Candidatus Staskawiczbacteria bacterium]|jgi:hypothetical protein